MAGDMSPHEKNPAEDLLSRSPLGPQS